MAPSILKFREGGKTVSVFSRMPTERCTFIVRAVIEHKDNHTPLHPKISFWLHDVRGSRCAVARSRSGAEFCFTAGMLTFKWLAVMRRMPSTLPQLIWPGLSRVVAPNAALRFLRLRLAPVWPQRRTESLASFIIHPPKKVLHVANLVRDGTLA